MLQLRHLEVMPISEAARADLYTGRSEVLVADRAETLMAQLPRFDPVDVATRSDMALLRSEVDALRSDVNAFRVEARAELHEGLSVVNQRLDRLFFAIHVGMVGVVTAMVGVIVSVA